MSGLGDKYIFEIAVYNIDPKTFFDKRQKELQAHFDRVNSTAGNAPKRSPDSNNEFDRNMRDRFLQRYGNWRYTQAIGWICLFPLGRQMRGEYWFVDAKRIDIHMNKKKFEFWGKAFELSFFAGEDSSLEIYAQIHDEIEKLKTEKPFKGLYIDIEPFENIGTFVNWHDMLRLG